MNFFKTLAMVGLVGVGMVYAEDKPKDLHAISPNGKWEAIAALHYHKDGTEQGYLAKILDLKSNRVVHNDAKDNILDNDYLAASISFYWSPDSKYLAQCNYVGRIAQSVSVFNPSKSEYIYYGTDLEHIFQKESSNGIFCYSLRDKPWLNNTDLEINVSYRIKDNQCPYPNITRKVIVRFHDNTSKVIRIGKPQ
jgi:hypothetical protein